MQESFPKHLMGIARIKYIKTKTQRKKASREEWIWTEVKQAQNKYVWWPNYRLRLLSPRVSTPQSSGLITKLTEIGSYNLSTASSGENIA